VPIVHLGADRIPPTSVVKERGRYDVGTLLLSMSLGQFPS
jgi:hypothetical protein